MHSCIMQTFWHWYTLKRLTWCMNISLRSSLNRTAFIHHDHNGNEALKYYMSLKRFKLIKGRTLRMSCYDLYCSNIQTVGKGRKIGLTEHRCHWCLLPWPYMVTVYFPSHVYIFQVNPLTVAKHFNALCPFVIIDNDAFMHSYIMQTLLIQGRYDAPMKCWWVTCWCCVGASWPQM